MIPVVSFIGPHAVGKTTLATKVVQYLKTRGLRVGVLKSTKEAQGDTDRPGSDTFLYRQVGADPVALWAQEEIAVYRRSFSREEAFYRFLVQEFADCDLVIAEGFKTLRFLPKIEVARRKVSESLLLEKVPGVVALATDFRPRIAIPVFDLEDAEGLAKFILERFYRPFEPQVELLVDGKPIGLKRHVRQALKGVIEGFLSSLRGVPSSFSQVEIHLKG